MPQPLDYARPNPDDDRSARGCLLNLVITTGLLVITLLAFAILVATVFFLVLVVLRGFH